MVLSVYKEGISKFLDVFKTLYSSPLTLTFIGLVSSTLTIILYSLLAPDSAVTIILKLFVPSSTGNSPKPSIEDLLSFFVAFIDYFGL